MLNHLLVYRWLIANALGWTLVGALVWSGHLLPAFETDPSKITFAIVALFLVGCVWTLKETIAVSVALNAAKRQGYEAASLAQADKALLKREWLEQISEWLVGLGLLGTIVGFSIALSGIDQGTVMQASGAQDAVGALMAGMRVALNTTLLGAALAIWHQVNLRMLKTALGCYWMDRVRAGAGEIPSRGMD